MNEAEPTTRLRLHVSTAVQGELFPATGTQPVTRGYKGTVASKVAGITYRQLDYWARRQIVEPSKCDDCHQFSDAAYRGTT